MAAGSASGAIRMFDLEKGEGMVWFVCCYGPVFFMAISGAVARTLTGHKSNVTCLDFHPYGEFLTSGSLDTNVKVTAVLVHSLVLY